MSYSLYYKKDKIIKHTKSEEVMDKLYYLEATIPTIEEIKTYKKDEDPKELINDIKKSISQIDQKIPLYDEYTKNLYLIPKENVYNRVVYQSYRFPNKE